MANNDKIYLSYIGELGEEFQNESKKRINWILSNVGTNQQILDLGCSQGIISILAAQKGNNVLGIDIEEDAIKFANDILQNKYRDVCDKVKFVCADYFNYKIDDKFDVILLTEVLEHLENPKGFVEKTLENLKPDGKIIITVPFGVNDHPDHKTTFYYSNFVKLFEGIYKIKDVKFMGRWIGITAQLSVGIENLYSQDLIRNLEENFYTIDRQMTDRIMSLYNNNIDCNEKYKSSIENYSILKDKYITVENNYKELKDKFNESAEKYRTVTENYETVKVKYRNLSESNTALKKQISQIEKKHSEFLKEYSQLRSEYSEFLKETHTSQTEELEVLNELKNVIKRLETQNNYLKSENAEYQRKMQLIKDTFVGKILIWGYHKLKFIKSKLGSSKRGHI